jgi:hypothetical protein
MNPVTTQKNAPRADQAGDKTSARVGQKANQANTMEVYSMENIESLQNKIKELTAAKTAAQTRLVTIEGETRSKQTELSDKLASGNNPDLKELEALRNERTRQELLIEGIDARLIEHNAALVKAKEDLSRDQILALTDQARDEVIAILKITQELFIKAARYRGLERKINYMQTDRLSRSFGSYGLNIDEIMNRSHNWLGRYLNANGPLLALLKEAGIMEPGERQKFIEDSSRILNAQV